MKTKLIKFFNLIKENKQTRIGKSVPRGPAPRAKASKLDGSKKIPFE